MNKSIETLRPVSELGMTKPHGTRLRYMAGCKCTPCRAANSRYETMRSAARKKGNWNGIVPARKARKHILKLSRLGIGYKTVADIAGLAGSTVFKVRSGERKNLRAESERAILAIDEKALPDSALVSAKTTWIRINWLLNQGFTIKELAKRLGYKTPALQINKKTVTAKTALKVKQFYDRIRLGE